MFRKAGWIDHFTHNLRHHVGLHVHDAADYSQPIPVSAALMMGPGLYVQEENYGSRIENMYLVTRTGAERLSVGIPRNPAEIEQAMAGGRRKGAA